MDFDADVMGDEPHDAFCIGCRNALTCVLQTARQPVNPEATVGVEHDFDDRSIFEIASDRRSKRGAQHTRAAREGL